MGKSLSALFLLVLVLCYALVVSVRGYEDEGSSGERGEGEDGQEEGRREKGDWFLLHESKHVVKTEAGNMKVVRGIGGRFVEKPMHIGFITMEPRSLFIPQYMDSSLIIFIRRGEARIGSIRKDELVEEELKTGDLYRIDAGSAFYLENKGKGRRLQIICSIDTSESLNWHDFQSFFIGGGRYPTSILSGFDLQTLSAAFNVSTSKLSEIMTTQQSGPIVFLSPDSHPPSVWTRFLALEQHEKKAHLKRLVQFQEDAQSEEEKQKWSLRKLLISLFGKENRKTENKKTKSDGAYNLYDRKPDFKNDYGWSMEVDESVYSPLSRSGIGIYLVNLTAGSMMAPHINPIATEYGIVLRGSGTIQIVYPNGTSAMNSKVSEGDVFWVPRYFPFCQISSRTGPFEFFGFTTSSRKNRPQFLVGRNSLLQTMRGPELAAAFGVSEDRLRKFIDAQRETTILPTASVAPPDQAQLQMMPKKLGNDLIMGISSKAEVITLTDDTFSDKVKEKDTAWFVRFCVPWCKHCKNLGTLWEDLGKAVEGEDEIEIGQVDCGTSKPVCSKVDIHSYPTFKLFYNGEEVAKYQGPRDVESLKTFVLEETEKAAAKAQQLDDDKEL